MGLAVMVGYHPPGGRGVRLSLGFLESAVKGLELFLAGLRMSDQRDQTLAVECYTYLVVQIFRPPFWNQVLIQFPAVVSDQLEFEVHEISDELGEFHRCERARLLPA